MAELNFPDPAVTNPWLDPNDVLWDHDGAGWNRVIFLSVTGYKNVIINGRLGAVTDPWIINQRGFNGDWAGLADLAFGYDRWVMKSLRITQNIEAANIVPNTEYVIHWTSPVGTCDIQLLGGQIYTSMLSGAVIMSGADLAGASYVSFNQVDMLNITNVQLELGTEPTTFEIRPVGLELSLCQRYYWKTYDRYLSFLRGTVGVNSHAVTVAAPVSFYRIPVVSNVVSQEGVAAATSPSLNGVLVTIDVASDSFADLDPGVIFEAEVI